MFGRRHRPPLAQRIKSWLWPERGFRRAGLYLVARLSRLKSSPHAIAAGFASGAAVSFTPLLGLHFVLAFVIAFLTRGSFVAAILGTVVGNPLTFPFIFAGIFWLGSILRDLFTDGEPSGTLDRMAELLVPDQEAEAEAEAAADAVLDTAEGFLEQGWSFASFDAIWPTLSTMLIGAVPVAILAWFAFYSLVRAAIGAYERQRRSRSGLPPR